MDEDNRAGAPRWFTLAALGALAWELIGCAMYLMQVSVDPAALPADQRQMWDATPVWMTGAYALAVWIGLVAAILLLMRRKLAEPLLLVSLIAVVVQFSGLLTVPALRNLVGSDMLFLPFLIVVVCGVIWHFARRARRSGWLH
ncbi:hypothetical protein G7076_09350 [Sphingomonas sp. HDW15A]|uniref:hypothetical protein n=1 Tax=Sphingomonas sp. HDW15A TaxID=2714942 RepID=UPI00140D2FCA|nr:hypothetical protein [Sphingomonas sp. HDW15A]QIK96613.1 hypothetical protein G7076_09350 [Sphingomonas sp. HDW15A]